MITRRLRTKRRTCTLEDSWAINMAPDSLSLGTSVLRKTQVWGNVAYFMPMDSPPWTLASLGFRISSFSHFLFMPQSGKHPPRLYMLHVSVLLLACWRKKKKIYVCMKNISGPSGKMSNGRTLFTLVLFTVPLPQLLPSLHYCCLTLFITLRSRVENCVHSLLFP